MVFAEPTLLDELICHISSLASVYHKPPSAFVEGTGSLVRKNLPPRTETAAGGSEDAGRTSGVLDTAAPAATASAGSTGQQPMVIPGADSLIGKCVKTIEFKS